MSKHLEDILNIAPSVEDEIKIINDEDIMDTDNNLILTSEKMSRLEKIEESMPVVEDLATDDKQLDEIAELAIQSFKDLNELGMNSEPRVAGEIFGAASNMLGHALTARKNKIERKLKTVELQLKKMRLDILSKGKLVEDDENTPLTGEAVIVSRNELIASLIGKKD